MIVFILGILFVPLLRHWDFYLNSRKKKTLLLVEISDCEIYLKGVINNYFKLLYALEKVERDQGKPETIPIPLVENFDLDFIRDFYKECLTQLSKDERKLIRTIPERLKRIKELSDDFNHQVLEKKYYNQRTARNVLWFSSCLYDELERLTDIKNEYKSSDSLNSIYTTKKVLNSLGFDKDQIDFSNALKSMLSEEKIQSLYGGSYFQVSVENTE